VAARVEPLCVRPDRAALAHLVLCILYAPFLYTVAILVLPTGAIVLGRWPGNTLAKSVVQCYWDLETALMQPLLCTCPRQTVLPTMSIVYELFQEVHHAERLHHR
jgi:hypothetical protein